MEGISHEAIGLAGKQRLNRLIVMWDDNGISIDGKVSLADVTDQKARFAAAGWSVHECDGHDPDDIDRALNEAKASDRPAMIDCHTHIGFGAPTKQDTKAAHGSPLGDDEIAKVREIYGWPYPPFEVPGEIVGAWRAIGASGAAAREAWEERLAKLSAPKRAEFARVMAGEMPRKLAQRDRRLQEGAGAGGAQGRHAQVVGDGAGGGERGDAGDARRVRRPDRFEQHADQGARRSSTPTIARDATSTTASASTAWRRR